MFQGTSSKDSLVAHIVVRESYRATIAQQVGWGSIFNRNRAISLWSLIGISPSVNLSVVVIHLRRASALEWGIGFVAWWRKSDLVYL